MSRNAIAAAIAAYVLAALAFGCALEWLKPLATGEGAAAFATGVVETAVLTLAASGIFPLVYWALRRFRYEFAAGPIFVWGALGIAYMVLFGLGTLWHQKIALADTAENISSLSGSVHDRFVRSVNTGCVANQQQRAAEQHSDVTAGQIAAYCQCFAEAMAKEVTVEEIMDIVRTGKLPATFEQKADKVTPACTHLALGH